MLDRDLEARGLAPVDGVLGAIGRTPLVALRRYLPLADLGIWAKLEGLNPGGSIKDRPAVAMLEQAIEDGLLTASTTVIESSSGNLGVGLAQACRYYGIRFICVVDSERMPPTSRPCAPSEPMYGSSPSPTPLAAIC